MTAIFVMVWMKKMTEEKDLPKDQPKTVQRFAKEQDNRRPVRGTPYVASLVMVVTIIAYFIGQYGMAQGSYYEVDE